MATLPWLIGHGRRTRNIIVQNVAWVLTIKGMVLGLANLWMVMAADLGASLLVTFNGLRLTGPLMDRSPRCGHLVTLLVPIENNRISRAGFRWFCRVNY